MFAVAKRSKPIAGSSARQIPVAKVSANTPEWRLRVNTELDSRGRGARADLTRHLKEKHPTFSSGQLTEILGPDEKPGQKRYSQYIGEIDRYLWPQMMPLSRDALELKHLLDHLLEVDKEVIDDLLDDSDLSVELRALAATIRAVKPK